MVRQEGSDGSFKVVRRVPCLTAVTTSNDVWRLLRGEKISGNFGQEVIR